MAHPAGQLAINIVGNADGVSEGFQDAKDQVKTLQSSMQQMGQKIGNLGRNMTKFITGPMAAMGAMLFENARRTGNYADRVLDLESATGLTTQTIQEYQAVADRAGVSTEALSNASQALTKQMTRSEGGSARMKRALDELGLSYEQLEQATPDEQMQIIIERLQGVEDAGKRARLGNSLLRNSYEELAPMLDMSAEETQKVIEQARESGRVMDKEALEAANKYRKGLDELKTEFTGLMRSIAVDFMPVLNNDLLPVIKKEGIPLIRSFSDTLSGFFEWFSGLPGPMQKTALAVTGMVGAAGPFLAILGPIISGLSTLVPLVAGLGTAIGATTSPLLAGVAALSGLGLVIFEVVRNWETASDMFVNTIKYFIDWGKYMLTNLKIVFFALPGIVLRAVEGIVRNLEILENVPFIGNKFEGLSDAISDASNSMQDKIEELGETAQEQRDNMVDSFEQAGASAKKFGIDVVDDVKAGLEGLMDVFSGTSYAADGSTESLEGLNVTTQESVFTTEEQSNAIENLKGPMEMATENFNQQTQAVLDNIDVNDELQSKLDAVEKKEEIWGDQIDVNAEKARILKKAINKKIESGDYEEAQLQNLIRLYNQYAGKVDKAEEKTSFLAQSVEDNLGTAFSNAFNEFNRWAPQFMKENQFLADFIGGVYDDLRKEIGKSLAGNLNNLKSWLGSVKESVGGALKTLNSQIGASLAKNLKQMGSWLASTLKMVGQAVAGFIQQAYAQLLAFYSWAGPGAPALAAGTIGAGMATLGKLAAEASELVGLDEGGETEDEGVAMLHENEVVFPLQKETFAKLAQGIVAEIKKLGRSTKGRRAATATANNSTSSSNNNGAAQRVINVNRNKEEKEVHLHVGTLVADRLGLKKLERRLQNIRVGEKNRKGSGNNGS